MSESNNNTMEEMPPMRSMAVRNQTAPVQFSAPSSLLGAKTVPSSSTKTPQLESRSSRSTSEGVAVKREWNKNYWNVSALDQVPLDFPLERTHREIYNVSVTDVCDRITKSLRLLSVEAEYDSDNGKVKCKTSDRVSFRIRLFAGDDGDDETNKVEKSKSVIVEVQRRSGSPSCFMRVCKKILDGAEGVDINAETVPARKQLPPWMMNSTGSIGEMKCLQDASQGRDPALEADTAIKKSLELLQSIEKDVIILGLENICFITDPLKTRPDLAMIACKRIMLDDVETEVRDIIESMMRSDKIVSDENDEEFVNKFFVDRCRHLSIVVLSNVLALTSQDGSLADAIRNNSWFKECLIPSLINEVNKFESSSNIAYEAACGLTYLATCSDVARTTMDENNAVGALRSANEFAIYNHELLAIESERALKSLGGN